MVSSVRPIELMLLGPYPPRWSACAYHCQSLVHQLAKSGRLRPRVLAVAPPGGAAGPEVFARLDQSNPEAYPAAAGAINRSGAQLVLVAHDFAAYAPSDVNLLPPLLKQLEIPYLVACHNVPARPPVWQQAQLRRICAGSAGVIALSPQARARLATEFGIGPEGVEMIPYGVPAEATARRAILKAGHGLAGKTVVLSCGPVCPGAGLEYGIRAVAQAAKRMAQAAKSHPELFYLVAGPTHPQLKAEAGEAYRGSLLALAASLGVRDKIHFINWLPGQRELLGLYAACDIYLAPFLCREAGEDLALTWAVGRGRAAVATPTPYASELLAEGRGLTAHFGDAASLANCLLQLAQNPNARYEMERRAGELAPTLQWPSVEARYGALAQRALAGAARQAVGQRPAGKQARMSPAI